MAQAALPIITVGAIRQHLVEKRDFRHATPLQPLEREPRRRRTTLAGDADFVGQGGLADDPDYEPGTWPDVINQIYLHDFGRDGVWHDDAEDDDPDHGIDDLPCDPREEDGV